RHPPVLQPGGNLGRQAGARQTAARLDPSRRGGQRIRRRRRLSRREADRRRRGQSHAGMGRDGLERLCQAAARRLRPGTAGNQADRKSTRLNSSHVKISYAVFCLKKKKKKITPKKTRNKKQ